MSNDTRWALTGFIGLLLWLPALGNTLGGDLDLPASVLRFALSLAVSFVAISAFERLVLGYALGTEADRVGAPGANPGGGAAATAKTAGAAATAAGIAAAAALDDVTRSDAAPADAA